MHGCKQNSVVLIKLHKATGFTMHFPYYIAKRLYFSHGKSFSRIIGKIALTAIALSVLIMILTVALVNGFQREITGKIFGYFGHIYISRYDFGTSYDDKPISTHQPFYHHATEIDNVAYIQVTAYKPAILKTADNLEGIVLKGIGKDFNWDFFQSKLIAGTIINTTIDTASNTIIISKYTATRLMLDTGDRISIHFLQHPPRVRNMTVCGIYNTGLEEFDKQFALIDIRHIQALNGWEETQVCGFEVFLHNDAEMHSTCELINQYEISPELMARTIQEIYPNVFDWLALQDMNKLIILALMTVVACVNIITCLLILILERTNMIGVLKALGADNYKIRFIFIYNAMYLVITGSLIGTVIAVGLCLFQHHFQYIKLPEASYYTAYAPVDINVMHIALINLFTCTICLLSMLVPSYLATRIMPSRILRFE